MNAGKIILGLIPFALFAVLGAWLPIGVAALIALASAVVAMLVDRNGGIKTIPLLAVVVLGIIAVLGFAGSPAVQDALATYGRGLATLVLGAFILATASRHPFTAQIARQSVPREYWTSERFVSVNRLVSRAWGYAVVVMAACHLVAGALGGVDSRPVLTIGLNWVVPIYVILQTVKYTRRTVGTDEPGAAVQHA